MRHFTDRLGHKMAVRLVRQMCTVQGKEKVTNTRSTAQKLRNLSRAEIDGLKSLSAEKLLALQQPSKHKHRLRGASVNKLEYLTYRGSHENLMLEKCILTDEEVAETIVDNILKHTQKGPDTEFVDNEASFCHISNLLAERNSFKKVTVLHRDIDFQTLYKSVGLHKDVEVHPSICGLYHLAQAFSHLRTLHPNFLSLYKSCPWDTPDPPYTMLGLGDSSIIKNLTYSVIFRHTTPSLFQNSRPELFLLTDVSTFLNLCGGRFPENTKHIITSEIPGDLGYYNHNKINTIFQVYFDFLLLDSLPRRSFLPVDLSKPKKLKQKKKILDNAIIEQNKDKMLLLYLRPKLDTGLCVDNPTYLAYFFYVMLRQQRQVTILPKLESWVSGLGLELIELGHSVFTTSSELTVPEMVHIFNKLVTHPEFDSSSFKNGAEALPDVGGLKDWSQREFTESIDNLYDFS